MSHRPTIGVSEVEKMSPDERAKLVLDGAVDDLSELDPAFRSRVEETGQRLLAERGLLDPEPK